MKRENCVQVKNVNKLSIPYLKRFFGSVGPIVKIQKDEISKYVTIQYANKHGVERVFRFEGRVLDDKPIKIRCLNQTQHCEVPVNLQKVESIPENVQEKTSLQLRDQSFPSNGSQQELFLLIHHQIKPHRLEQNQHLILSIFIWRLADQISTDIKHFINYKVNMRSSYLKMQLQRQIIERINRLTKDIIAITDSTKSVTIQTKNSQKLIWFSVPYPNTEEEQCKIETGSLMTKCIQTIKNQLSIRIAFILNTLYTASLHFNNEESKVDNLINLNTRQLTSPEDSFQGIVENVGAKNIFFNFINYEQPNSCISLKETKVLQRFQCTTRLKCPNQSQLKEYNWCDYYRGQLCRKINFEGQEIIYVKNKFKIDNIKLGQESLIFEQAQFSLFRVGKEIVSYRQVATQPSNVEIVYIMKQSKPEKVMQFKKVYEDKLMQIQNEIEEISVQKQVTEPRTEQFEPIKQDEEFISWINLIEIKFQNASQLNHLKLSHYLQDYIEESVIGKGLIIASRQMASKLATNIIQREREGRLFEFAERKYEKYIGDELWRLYQNRSERKIKNMLSKYMSLKNDR